MFRKLDGLAQEIQRYQPPVKLWRKFIYCTSLSGSILGSVDHMKRQGVVYPSSSSLFQLLPHRRLLLDLMLEIVECVHYNNLGPFFPSLGDYLLLM